MTFSLVPVRSADDLLATDPDGTFLIRIDRNGVVHAHSRESTLIDGRHTARAFFGDHSDEQLYSGVYAEAPVVATWGTAEVLDDLEVGAIIAFGAEIAPFLAFHKLDDETYLEITDGSLGDVESIDEMVQMAFGKPVVLLTKRAVSE